MKNIIILLCMVGVLANCSSNEKETYYEKADKTTMDAKAKMEAAAKKAEMEAKAAAEQAAAMQAEKAKAAAKAAAMMQKGDASSSYTCTLNGDTRTISVLNNSTGGCTVEYTKFDNTQNVANAANDISYCENVVNKIKGNLESANFACQ